MDKWYITSMSVYASRRDEAIGILETASPNLSFEIPNRITARGIVRQVRNIVANPEVEWIAYTPAQYKPSVDEFRKLVFNSLASVAKPSAYYYGGVFTIEVAGGGHNFAIVLDATNERNTP